MLSSNFVIIVIVMVFFIYGEKVKWIIVNFSFFKVFGLSFKLDCVKIMINVIFCNVVDYVLLILLVILMFGIFLRMKFIISMFNRDGRVFLESFFVKNFLSVVIIMMMKILKILLFGKRLWLIIDYKIV